MTVAAWVTSLLKDGLVDELLSGETISGISVLLIRRGAPSKCARCGKAIVAGEVLASSPGKPTARRWCIECYLSGRTRESIEEWLRDGEAAHLQDAMRAASTTTQHQGNAARNNGVPSQTTQRGSV